MCSLVIRQWRRALLVSECAGRQLQALSMRRHKYTGSCSASSSSSSSSSIKTGAQPLNRWLSGIRSSVGVQSRGRLLSSAASTEAVSLALTDDKLLEQCRILVGKSSGPGGGLGKGAFGACIAALGAHTYICCCCCCCSCLWL